MKNKLTNLTITILLLVSFSVLGKNVAADEQSLEVQSYLTGSWFFVSYINRKGAKFDDPSSFGMGLNEDTPYLILFDNGEGKVRFSKATLDGTSLISTIGYANMTYELIDNEIKISINDDGKQLKVKVKYELENNGNIKLYLDRNDSLILQRKLTR
jgi:hypothetical protein